MDFAILPPEINSVRMYAGPGSGPMLAAAQAWDGLADELHAAASSYQSVVSELTSGSWVGPSSSAMTAAAASYAAWLSSAAAQAEETAAQANAAAAAYEAAFMSTVPPPVIAANRSLLMALVATNFFGQNTPAIATTEAQYAEMWAQDAAAMYGYAGSSAAATALTPFGPPQQNTNPGGSAGQAAAIAQAMTTPAGNAQSIVSSVPETFSAVPNALQSLATAAPAAAADPSSPLDTLSDLITIFLDPLADLSLFGAAIPLSILSGPADIPFSIASYLVSAHMDDIVSGWNGEEGWPGTGPAPVKEFPAIITNPGQTAASTVSAGLGEANTVGALSVPSSWTVAAPEIRPVTLTLPATNATAISAAPLEAGSASTFNEMGLAGMAGQAMAGPPGTGGGQDGGETGTSTRVLARPGGAATAGGAAADGEGKASQSKPRIVITGVAARIRELAKLRDEGILTHEEFTEQKNRLLGH